MAYINFQNCTKEEYETTLYSQDAKNKIKILFNNIELQNADLYCEKFTVKSRIMPNGSKVFSLNSFVSKEAELILHDINTSVIQDQVSISIGTLVGNFYEYVPIGIFNIEDQPTNDKDKTTIKLRDNSVKFDFNYNAKPLIDANGGSVTKMQILQDICSQANVTCAINSFMGDSDLIGIYDNTITARQYIADLAESAGAIATINREGELIFVYLNGLTSWKIPLNIVEKYDIGKPYKIGRVVFEDGIVRFETQESEFDTLYLESSNPYISNQTQVENILNLVNGFEIDSFKTGNVLGNPAIDGYDIIEIYGYYELLSNGNKIFIPNIETILAKTLATMELTYTGVLTNSFDTQIGEEEREKNISIIGEPTFKKWVKTELNNIEGTLTTTVGQVGEQNEKISQITQSVNEINAKISDISNITTSGETSYASVNLIDVNESNPISIKIRPIIENICYLYPYSTLYPSNTTYLKTRILQFTNTSTDEIFKWELPTDLWYYSETIYDDLELSYGDGTNAAVIVTRKCKINADNTISVLDEPTTETYEYPMNLILSTGDYTIQLLGYTNAYLYVQLMASNIYTTQFATKVELNSSITQTKSEINARVSLKLDTTEFTHASIVAKINDNTSQILIDADKINITATNVLNILANNTLNLTSKNIAISSTNFSVDASGYLTCSGANIQGVLNAGSGSSIGGWIAAENQLSSGQSSQYVALNSSNSNTYAMWAGNNEASSAPFRISKDGTLYATKGSITGSLITSGINASNITSGTLNISNGNSYYLKMGFGTSHPQVSGLNVTGNGGINIQGLGFNSDGSRFTFSGGVQSSYFYVTNGLTINSGATLTCYGNIATNQIKPGGYLQIATGGRTGYGTNSGSIYLFAAAHITLNAAWDHYVYIGNANVGNARAAVDSSGPSSKCLKTNIKEFKNSEYDDALTLLNDIKLYDYNYKYKIHDKKDQFGFMIDDLLNNDLAKKYFYFKDEKAGINENNYLDYSAPIENKNKMPIIEFKRYDEETLIKYLLVVCKALQNKINKMEGKNEN